MMSSCSCPGSVSRYIARPAHSEMRAGKGDTLPAQNIPRMKNRLVRLGAVPAVAALALFNSGCLAAAVGACAAGAGVTCNAYRKGKVCHVYGSDLNDATAAARTALTEM